MVKNKLPCYVPSHLDPAQKKRKALHQRVKERATVSHHNGYSMERTKKREGSKEEVKKRR